MYLKKQIMAIVKYTMNSKISILSKMVFGIEFAIKSKSNVQSGSAPNLMRTQ